MGTTMIRDAVGDWSELSALYERADELDAEGLATWLAKLRADQHRLVSQLERMLVARERIAQGDFLEGLPRLGRIEARTLDQQALEGGVVGAYRLLRPIGSGGMAEVWLAERADGAFERRVAIKLLFRQPSRAHREGLAERFRRERDILASLDHPNIASLHDAGVTPEGQPWLALEYVEGEPIVAWCDRKLLSIEERVTLFQHVLAAVEFAHANLVIHRDLKPSNILVTERGEVRLLDFGISKLLERDSKELKETELTRASGRPLTPEYASPEQLANRPLTVASDVYSLGVVLYELLVGVRPHGGDSWSAGRLELAKLDSDAEAPSRRPIPDDVAASRRSKPTEVRKALRPDLDAILLKALNRSTAERYESVAAFRADLERWERHEPVSAVAPGSSYRLARFARRHRLGVAVGGLVVVVLTAAATIAGTETFRAQQEASRALAAKDFLLDMFRLANPAQTQGGDVSAARLLDGALERARTSLVDQPRLRVEVLRGIAEINQNLGRYGSAHPILQEAATILADLGDRRELTAMQVELADNALQMGDVKTSSALLDQAEPGLREFKSDHRLQARGHETRGWLLRIEGDFHNAENHMLAFLDSATAAYGRTDNRRAEALRGLAEVEAGLREYDRALSHIREARVIASSAKNATALDRVGIDVEQARIEFDAGRFRGAQPMLVSAIEHCDQTLGQKHELCFFARSQLARLLIYVGNAAEAMKLVPALRIEIDNDLSPRRQSEAAVAVGRVLAANASLPADDPLRARLRNVVDLATRGDLSKDIGLSAKLALAEIALRDGRVVDVATELGSFLEAAPSDGETQIYLARGLLLHGLAQQLSGHPAESLLTLQAAGRMYSGSLGPDSTFELLCRVNQVPALLATDAYPKALWILEDAVPKLQSRLPADATVLRRLEQTRAALKGERTSVPSSARRAVFFD